MIQMKMKINLFKKKHHKTKIKNLRILWINKLRKLYKSTKNHKKKKITQYLLMIKNKKILNLKKKKTHK